MLGIDIGHSSTKVVELQGGRITGLRRCSYADRAEAGTEILSRALQEITEAMNARKKPAWGSISGTSVITHLKDYPGLNEAELAGAAQLEAEQFVSRDWGEMDFDYQVQEQLADGGFRVLFASAPRELSDSNIALFHAAGLYAAGMSVNSLAMAEAYRAAAERTGAPETEGAVIINMGAQNTSLALLHGARIVVLRDISFGGNDITRGLMKEFETDFAGAEKIKLQGDAAAEVADCVGSAIRPLSQQISMTIGYEHGKGSTGGDSILLGGGGSRAPGLSETLLQRFEMPVRFFDPFAGLTADCELPGDEAGRSEYAIALGCALIGGNER